MNPTLTWRDNEDQDSRIDCELVDVPDGIKVEIWRHTSGSEARYWRIRYGFVKGYEDYADDVRLCSPNLEEAKQDCEAFMWRNGMIPLPAWAPYQGIEGAVQCIEVGPFIANEYGDEEWKISREVKNLGGAYVVAHSVFGGRKAAEAVLRALIARSIAEP